MKQRKQMIAWFLTVAMLLSMMPQMVFAAGDNFTVSMNALQTNVAAGETFTLDITASSSDAGASIGAVHTDLTYDASKVEYVSIASASGSSIQDLDVKNENGKLTVAAYGDAQNVTSDGTTLVTLTFKALDSASGSAEFKIGTPKVGTNGTASDISAKAGDAVSVTIERAASELITEIRTEEDLRAFAHSVNSGNSYKDQTVTLENDIELTQPWTEPIGNSKKTAFQGTFDGQDHSISDFKINYTFTDPENDDRGNTQSSSKYPAFYFALFGVTDSAEIKNITLDGSIFVDNKAITDEEWTARREGTYAYIGGISAYAKESSFINCTNNVDISAHSGNIGGISGTDEKKGSSFTDCFNYGNITVRKHNTLTGGIAPFADSMLRCGNYGNITVNTEEVVTTVYVAPPAMSGNTDGRWVSYTTAYGSAAGLSATCLTMKECFNKGSVKGWGRYIGGLMSGYYVYNYKPCTVSDSYNTGVIELSVDHYDYQNPDRMIACTAGLVGTAKTNTTLVNCYNSGSVTSKVTTKYGVKDDIICNSPWDDISVTVTQTNCLVNSADAPVTASALNTGDEPKFKDDDEVSPVNGGTPLLIWEKGGASEETYAAKLTCDVKDAKITVYSDAAHTKVVEPVEGVYQLPAATYFYTAEADGYFTSEGSFTIVRKDVEVSIPMTQSTDVTIKVTPASASFTLKSASGDEVSAESSSDGTYKYKLVKGGEYSYTATASGYNGVTKSFTAGDEESLAVTLTASSHPGTGDTDRYIYGSYNSGKTSEITKGGTYYVGHGDGENGAQGTITISTTEPVTLVGTGIADSDKYEYLFIDCTEAGADLTLQDLYISNVGEQSNTKKVNNLIDFTGKNNKLHWKGTSILDHDQNAAGYAMIHVNQDASLTMGGVDDSDTIYFYKREQGAGVGGNGGARGSDGQVAETNGDITVTGGILFAKNSKQGAFFGAGADSASKGLKPGSIHFEGGTITLIGNSRSAAIGGSAGNGGASGGSEVYVDGAAININVDFSGAAIGGGGFDGGNDSDGGTLYYSSGSIRTYIDRNAMSSWNVEEPGIHGNKTITANVVNSSGEPLQLLILDTDKLSKQSGTYTVKEGGDILYQGGLHEYTSVNENKEKDSQTDINYTIDNWTSLDDSNLYLYATGEDHTFTVNGQTVKAVWNEETQTFDLTYENSSDPGSNPGTSETYGNVEITTGEHGTTTVSPQQAKAGDPVTITATPDEGYGVDQITAVDANGNAIDVTDNGDGTYTFTMPAGKVNVNVSFAPIIDIDAGTNGTATVDNNSPKTGDKVTVTVTPNDGYEVDTVTVTDKDGKAIEVTANEDGTYSFAKPEGNVSVKVTYKTADPDENCPSRKYSDLDTSLWYHEAVDFVLNSKYFQGTSDSTFEPDSTMTRAMFVTVLSRLEGIDGAQYSGSDFTDVETGQWYTAAIQWASQNGIVLGVGEQKFDPEGEVTREQMAAIMYRYAQYKKIDTTKADASKFGSFSDKDSVSDWAVEAMTWATGIGIINGTDTGIEPQANSTRAQVAQIVKNYTEKVS